MLPDVTAATCDVEIEGDVGHRRDEYPAVAVEAASVEHLDQDLRVAAAEEPEQTRLRRRPDAGLRLADLAGRRLVAHPYLVTPLEDERRGLRTALREAPSRGRIEGVRKRVQLAHRGPIVAVQRRPAAVSVGVGAHQRLDGHAVAGTARAVAARVRDPQNVTQLVTHDLFVGLARIRRRAQPLPVAVLRRDVRLDDRERLDLLVPRNFVRRDARVAVEEGVRDRDRAALTMPVRPRDLVERILVGDRVHSVNLVGPELRVQRAPKDQVRPARRIVVPGADRRAHLGQTAAGHPGLTARLDGHPDAALPVELSPPQRETVVEAGRRTPGEPERLDDPQGPGRPIDLEVVGRPVRARGAVGDPAAKPVRVAGPAIRLARQQDALPRPDLEEQAETELDRAIDTVPRFEEEEHPVVLGQHRQAENPHRHAVRPDAARLANEDRAARDEALQHVLDFDRVVRRRPVRAERRHNGPDLAEHDDRRALDHRGVGRQDVDRGGGGGRHEEGEQEWKRCYSRHGKANVSLAGTATCPCRLRCDQRSLSPSVT